MKYCNVCKKPAPHSPPDPSTGAAGLDNKELYRSYFEESLECEASSEEEANEIMKQMLIEIVNSEPLTIWKPLID